MLTEHDQFGAGNGLGGVQLLQKDRRAGGQLEQPSEVNSSTRTGWGAAVGAVGASCAGTPNPVVGAGRQKRPENNSAAPHKCVTAKHGAILAPIVFLPLWKGSLYHRAAS